MNENEKMNRAINDNDLNDQVCRNTKQIIQTTIDLKYTQTQRGDNTGNGRKHCKNIHSMLQPLLVFSDDRFQHGTDIKPIFQIINSKLLSCQGKRIGTQHNGVVSLV